MRLPDTLRVARSAALAAGVHSLTTGALQNPKVAKSAAAGRAYTLPLHLAPADSAGRRSVCPFAGACKALCLDGAGNPAYARGKSRARIARTLFWHDRPELFLIMLTAEIAAHVADARARGMRPAVRLNATSDILWERCPVTIPADLSHYLQQRYGVRVAAREHRSIMAAFPRVQFYDYTKVPWAYRAHRIPRNYHLTYSYDPQNLAHVSDALAIGWNVAVPFSGRDLPREFMGRPVIDGDVHDYRPADGRAADGGPVIVGLRFKRITNPATVARIGIEAARTGAGFAVTVN